MTASRGTQHPRHTSLLQREQSQLEVGSMGSRHSSHRTISGSGAGATTRVRCGTSLMVAGSKTAWPEWAARRLGSWGPSWSRGRFIHALSQHVVPDQRGLIQGLGLGLGVGGHKATRRFIALTKLPHSKGKYRGQEAKQGANANGGCDLRKRR